VIGRWFRRPAERAARVPDGEAGAQAGEALAGAGEVLAPLAGRSRRAGRPAADEDPAEVRAMPMVLRIERAAPPPRTALLEAAAAAALAVCLDARVAPGGEWHDAVALWVHGRIRKVVRRARGAHWAAVAELPGVTVTVDGASVRALVPTLVAETPREVSRLQISGTDLPLDTPGPPPEGVPVVWLNPGLELSVGKAAAQVGHASMLLAAAVSPRLLAEWAASGLRCAVRTAAARDWPGLRADADADAGRAVAVRDAGFTEVEPGTVTCVATWR
jgi:peptidyl-tRNA hydrolase